MGPTTASFAGSWGGLAETKRGAFAVYTATVAGQAVQTGSSRLSRALSVCLSVFSLSLSLSLSALAPADLLYLVLPEALRGRGLLLQSRCFCLASGKEPWGPVVGGGGGG